MHFENGIVSLASWLGNVILPTLSGLFFAIAIVQFAGPGQHQSWMYTGLFCLMASGILRALEFLSSQRPWNDPDLYWISVLSLVNWICNVAMPLYGVLQIVVGIMHFAGIGHRIYQGASWMRHFAAAAGCFMLSGIVRLAEWFVQQGAGGLS
jgi:uncharacterized membrane protein